MIKDVRFNNPRFGRADRKHREENAVDAAGGSRSLGFLKTTLNLAFVADGLPESLETDAHYSFAYSCFRLLVHGNVAISVLPERAFSNESSLRLQD